MPSQRSQEGVLLAECAWYRDILYFLQELKPLYGMRKSKARDLKLKAVILPHWASLILERPSRSVVEMFEPTRSPESYV